MTIFALIAAGDVDGLSELLEARPDKAGERNDEGLSPVLAALYGGKHDLVDPILDANPPLDVFDSAAVGRTRGLQALLEDDPALASSWSPDGFTPLHLAAYFGEEDAAKTLLEHGADPNAVSRHAEIRVAPVQSAAAGEHDGIVRLLLEHGARLEDLETDELRARYADQA